MAGKKKPDGSKAEFEGKIGDSYRESTPWWPESRKAPQGAPNVLFVVLDDAGFADLGCYGSEIETPNIDRLARNGLRYTNFHTTAMCSPTRACLLTGRQSHAVGVGIIAEWTSGFPGYQGRISRRAATLAEILQARGYNTYAVGKWHLMPMSHATAAGPFEHWPLQRGFDRWYGFHGALADHWNPEIFEDNHAVERAKQPGYHLTADLVDRSVQYVRDHEVNAPDRPYFLYLALGAPHWPHHVPADFIRRYAGRYDRGWDAIREERLKQQKAMEIVPAGTELAPRNPDVRAWDELSPDQRRLFARMQEVYAGFIEHTDAHLGRLLDALEYIGQLDNTLVLLISDNGASPEGGTNGAVNTRKHTYYAPETLKDCLAAIDKLGTEHALNHYPTGWAQASNTPLKWYKKEVHGGGARDPLIVYWKRIADRGGVRTQYHHAVDVLPTVLEVVGITAPEEYQGHGQMPIHGTSFAYTFDAPDVPTKKQIQYYELVGNRGIWHQGWKAVSRHEKGAEFGTDRWELYHLAEDFAEARDLAQEQPERLRDLVERWWLEARTHHVLPLDDREFAQRAALSIAAAARKIYTYFPGISRIERLSSPAITNRSYSITAEVEIPASGAEGVLLSAGGHFGGYVLYVQDSRLVYEYLYADDTRYVLRSSLPVPAGRVVLRFEFARTAEYAGAGTLLIDGANAGAVEIPKTWPVSGSFGGLYCGRDGGTPVSRAYDLPFAFTGVIRRVQVKLGDDGQDDAALLTRASVAEE